VRARVRTARGATAAVKVREAAEADMLATRLEGERVCGKVPVLGNGLQKSVTHRFSGASLTATSHGSRIRLLLEVITHPLRLRRTLRAAPPGPPRSRRASR
jgi:hypothetical protein